MTMTDPIADMLTRIRNANTAMHDDVSMPSSKIKGTRGPWPSGANDHIVLDGSQDGVLKADNAFIVQPDVTTSNGTIQVVDEVMIAGSVPETNPTPPPEEPAAAPPPAPAAPAAKAPAKKKK